MKNSDNTFSFFKNCFLWRWGTPGKWGNTLNRGQKIARFCIESQYSQVKSQEVVGALSNVT